MTFQQRSQPPLLSSDVARRLETFVLDGGYKPGDKLPSERDLAVQFGVSRTAIREGIKLLTQSGLLQSSVGRGLYVGDLSTEPVLSSLNVLLRLGGGTVRDVVQVRNALEVLAARLAAVRATSEHLAELESLVGIMATKRANLQPYGKEGPQFHIVMARASQNPLIVALLEPALALMYRVERTALYPGPSSVPGTQRGLDNHYRILAALRERDPDAAAAAIEDHCQYLIELRTSRYPEWEELKIGESEPREEVAT
jgi:GntR family transcriptional repressor for pyruvate dehydrogenase complex